MGAADPLIPSSDRDLQRRLAHDLLAYESGGPAGGWLAVLATKYGEAETARLLVGVANGPCVARAVAEIRGGLR